MAKPKLLYASPFWPKNSGISEYSAVLVYGLSKYFDITLCIDNYRLDDKRLSADFPVVHYQKGDSYKDYPYILYNIGNNPYYHNYMYDSIEDNPGFVILHDVYLYYLTVGHYMNERELLSKIYQLEGAAGIQVIKDSIFSHQNCDLLEHDDISYKLPLNIEIIQMCKGVLVHSQYAENIVNKLGIIKDVFKINFPRIDNSDYKGNTDNPLSKRYKVPENCFAFGSVGFIAYSKQNHLVCQAVKLYNRSHDKKVNYIMVGEGNYIDEYLDEYIKKTGFLSNKELWDCVDKLDFVFNLRYPYGGETSASLILCMGKGKLCAVTDIGWFSELPDDCVIKLPEGISAEKLCNKLHDFTNTDYLGYKQNAKNYVENNSTVEKISEDVFNILTRV